MPAVLSCARWVGYLTFSEIEKMNRESTVLVCDRIMEYALYILIFFLPISKAIIEICASLAILAFIIKKIIMRKFLAPTPINKFLFIYLCVCAFAVIFSTNIHLSLRAFFSKLLKNLQKSLFGIY